MLLHCRRALKHTCWGTLLTFLSAGIVDGALLVSIPGPSPVDAKVGSNVTLRVLYTGATDPNVEWLIGTLPIATWTVGSSAPPNIPAQFDALSIENDGSLTFRSVQLEHSNTYTVRMSKSGVGTDTAMVTLRVFDVIENVSVSSEPVKVVEGASAFTLGYSTLRGEADSAKWYFDGKEITNGIHYIIGNKNLKINNPTRSDTGRYSLVLTNPFSSETIYKMINVLYGPDQPVLKADPPKMAFDSGDSLLLSCQADGDPTPSASWLFGGLTLPASQDGTLNLTDVQTSQSGVYTCVLVNEETGARLERNFTLNVYESPSGSPVCSVQGVNGDQDLQYRCQWPGGMPEAQLSFPALNDSRSWSGDFNLTVPPSQDLSGKEIICWASHPLLQRNCSITARGPVDFLPLVLPAVDSNGRLVATIVCPVSAVPAATMTWSKAGQVVSSGGRYLISPNTTLLFIKDLPLNTSGLGTYTCEASNPFGSKTSEILLLGPTISDSSLVSNQEGTVATLTWETPRTSITTGFEVQMKGPDLQSSLGGSQRRKRATEEFRTIQNKPANVSSADLGVLDPKSTYWFRVVPVAGRGQGEPSKVHRIGPRGLSGAAIAGIAAGIPCGLLLLLLLILLIVFCVCKRRRRQTRYPVSRAVEKAVTAQPNLNTPHNLLTGGLKTVEGPPDYNVHQASAERSSTLPSTVSPPPVRMATTTRQLSKTTSGFHGNVTEPMGCLGSPSVLGIVVQAVVVWSVVVAGKQWRVTFPAQISAPAGSCMVIPCSFPSPSSPQTVDVSWYQYAKYSYPMVYSKTKGREVIAKFRGRTEIVGSTGEGNCSLKINSTQVAHNAERIYVWINPNNLSGTFYEKMVTLQVTAKAAQPEMQVSGELTEGAAVRLTCSVVHTCPPSPPYISLSNHRGVLKWSHVEEGAGHSGIVLNVTYPPKSVRIHGDSSIVPPGGNVSLSCRSEANPPAGSFRWYRTVRDRRTLLYHTSESISVGDLDPRQNLFHCAAENSRGITESAAFEVIAEYAPVILPDSKCTLGNGRVSGWVLRSVLSGPVGAEDQRFYCNATNQHGEASHQLPFTADLPVKWLLAFGAAGGTLLLILLFGVFSYRKRAKRQCTDLPITDLPLKKCNRVEGEVKTDNFYENLQTLSHPRVVLDSLYTVEDAPRYQDEKKRADFEEDTYANC
ncbi:hypothetical protein AAFF_G00329100 [Aldrovandia affinis]|uniref:Ig-like domain-containing protein n=1 Tax=Aldrovandia affinis TaxID=143900 RepID=A0AAD7SLV9_9TELE|nr:hypothetical protein AAFF_G00329100 [Aldrovandia affinis]